MFLLRNHRFRLLTTTTTSKATMTASPLSAALALVSDHIQKSRSAKDIEKVIAQTPREHFGSISCSMAIGKLGQYKSPNAESLAKMLSVAQSLKFNPRSLSSTVYALAQGRLVSRLPDFLMDRLGKCKVDDFTPHDFSKVLWSMAKLHSSASGGSTSHDAPVLHKFIDRLVKDEEEGEGFVSKFNSQDLANTMWAVAVLHRQHGRGDEVAELVVQELVHNAKRTEQLAKFQPQEVCNIMWALAKLNYRGEDDDVAVLATRVRDAICAREDDAASFTQQGIANLLWAYQKLGQDHLPLAQRFVHQLLDPNFRLLGK